MKIWITVDSADYGGCEIHIETPVFLVDVWASSCDSVPISKRATRILRKIMNLTDWPNLNEVMEYDTETEIGIITQGEVE